MPPSLQYHGAAIAFLHTAAIHIETFNALRDEFAPGLAIAHAVREDLLIAAEKAGGLTPATSLRTQEALLALAQGGARVVVCTCSTLGEAAEQAAREADVPVMRIDRPMADRAVRDAGRIGICATLAPTLAPTRDLIASSAARAGRDCDIREFLFDDVWPAFREGRLDDYYEGVAARLSDASKHVDLLVLAQASMAPAAALAGALRAPLLSSPRIGFEAAARIAGVRVQEG
ncbi:aspartate/glutamate racemase family protein [Parvibaculum sp.]|uniref:aspartate/glutamate racemase family protein n=1 Tax=Parvibaculum sp. TaxID=2024848 RepID=UPI002732025A|nr:aspartate/glutamate racemase family protein [Parvibaculum sp.]MDP1627021.1 aspartate/glutamate racemase family protein [Parvibaculum sp.]MDP2149815.1 aspartate/glutamate racemase family protein [Parvibaculum sp.]MDP3327259.1 aspartate/glutamate racemase family protein [Parvibaculum sp.]